MFVQHDFVHLRPHAINRAILATREEVALAVPSVVSGTDIVDTVSVAVIPTSTVTYVVLATREVVALTAPHIKRA